MLINKHFHLTPVRLVVLSFLGLILLGTLLLFLPISVGHVEPIKLMDAFFTATSAVCVTGLVVVDTGSFFSMFGQGVILFLIQIGGLGIMTLYASLPVIFGQQFTLSQRRMFSAIFDAENYQALITTIKAIVMYTIVIELIGALILSWRFYALWGHWKKAVYYGVFHAVSAFCNAGFMLFSNGLADFKGDWIINLVLIALYSLGGIGFIVIYQVFKKRTFKKLSSNSRLALLVSFILIAVPCFIVFHYEFDGALAGYSILDKTIITLMHVTSTRTAGFNSVDMGSFSNATLFLFCILMFIGASPGGTAGGVKTTTIGLMFLSIRSVLNGKSDIECYGRCVPRDVLTRTVGILTISFSVVTVGMILLMMTENAEFTAVFFEVISAFGTVGLTLGLTPDLTLFGKILICFMMFIGRVGSLTLLFMLGTEDHAPLYQYPLGRFMVG